MILTNLTHKNQCQAKSFLTLVILMGCSVLVGCQPQTSSQKSMPMVAPSLSNGGLTIDSDKDGVIDSQDQCPHTLTNVIVDSKGCVIETEIDLGVRVFFHGLYPKNLSTLSPNYQQDIDRAINELRDFNHQWVIMAVFSGKASWQDSKNSERLLLLKQKILQNDNKINSNNIVMYQCGTNDSFLPKIKVDYDLTNSFDNIYSPQPQLYAFFTNMNQEFSKQNASLSSQCQRLQ